MVSKIEMRWFTSRNFLTTIKELSLLYKCQAALKNVHFCS